MPKNYYVILGIPTDSTVQDIKSAFRRLAKIYHPDFFEDGKSPFMAIKEAYSVLSDPDRRKQYDATLRNLRVHAEQTHTHRHPERHYDRVEPLIPENYRAEPLDSTAARSLQTLSPELDSLVDLFFNIVSEEWDYGRESETNFDVEVSLTQDQALQGGHIQVRLPAQRRCMECGGHGRIGYYECRRCFGEGVLRGEIPFLLNYPAGIPHNHTVRFALERFGLSHISLFVRFRHQGMA